MAAIIHIQEVTSSQVTEVIMDTTEAAIMAYARNAAANWDRLFMARFRYYPGDKVVRRAVIVFDTEKLVVKHEASSAGGHRYLVAWLPD